MPFLMSYKRSDPNVFQIMKKHWFIFRINENLAKTFADDTIIFFKRTRNLKWISGSITIKKGIREQ